MRKIFSLFVFLVFLASNGYCADQWTKGDPQGTESSGTIDNIMRINQAAQDRLLNEYRRGLGVNYATAATLTVLPGEIAIPNSAASVVRYRETTSNTTITWADIDTGAEENSTSYNLFATGDTDVADMVFKISKSAAPSGSTYYRKIATFYNNSSGNIENVISLRNDNGTDSPDLVKAWVNFTGTGTVTINDSYGVSSVTDNGTGDYTVTWTTSFINDNYSVVAM